MLRYDDIAKAITARHLATPLLDAMTTRPDETAITAAARLRSHAFDQAPVMADGQVAGWVLTTDLEASPARTVRRVMRRLTPSSLVSADAPVRTVLEALVGSEMVFVVSGRHVDGFIVAADINRHAARTHFYLLVADLELALVALLRRWYARPDALLGRIPSAARSQAIKRYERDRAWSTEIDQLAVLDFSDLLTIVGRSPKVRRLFLCRTEDDWQRRTRRMNRFRIAVMHPSAPFIGEWKIEDVLEMETRLREVLGPAWTGLRIQELPRRIST